jgi:hypothetical protein
MNLAIWTNTEDETANYVCSKKPNTMQIVRFNSDEYFPNTQIKKGSDLITKIDVIWYRRPFENELINEDIASQLRFSENEEAQWNYFLKIPKRKWVNYPSINWYADKKTLQLEMALQCGLNIPDWILTNEITKAKKFLDEHDWKCIIKPINCGYYLSENNVYHIYTNEVDKERVNLELITKCPTFFQEKIEKEFDVRTVFINGKIIFVGIWSNYLDVRRDEMKNAVYKIINPPSSIYESYKLMIKKYKLRFCTSDFVVDKKGTWIFLENNPNGQWVWMNESVNGALVDLFYNNIWSML